MASRILLISANRCTHPDPVFPLGLSYIAAALESRGHDCLWLDPLADADQFSSRLGNSRADYVGISLRNVDDVLIRKRQTFYSEAADLVTIVKRELGCPVILGGSGFSIFPHELLAQTGADFGITGEGETALPDLINALEQGRSVRNIPGLVYPDQNRSVVSNRPAHAGQLDVAPSRPDSICTHYVNTGSMLNLQTQRGCSFCCCYCTYPVIEGKLHRPHAPEQVAEDFQRAAKKGARYLFIVDSVFNSSHQHVSQTCEALIRSGNKVPWGCFLRPHGLCSDLMELMVRAGLSHAEFGADSFCDQVLVSYQKNFTFDDILTSSLLAKRHKVDYCHFLISGGPGETLDTLDEGFRNSQRLEAAVIMAVVGMRIYPGTALFDRALRENRVTRKTNLLEPVYYISDGLSPEAIFEHLRQYSQKSPNWLIGDPDPAYQRLVSRLRQRGVVGPLWSYLSMLQRVWPPETSRNTQPATR